MVKREQLRQQRDRGQAGPGLVPAVRPDVEVRAAGERRPGRHVAAQIAAPVAFCFLTCGYCHHAAWRVTVRWSAHPATQGAPVKRKIAALLIAAASIAGISAATAAAGGTAVSATHLYGAAPATHLYG